MRYLIFNIAVIGALFYLLSDKPLPKEIMDIPRMGDRAISMLKHSLEAFLTRDPDKAEATAMGVGPHDHAVDSMYATIQGELMELMRIDPENVETGTYLMWAAHNVERIADRATNIAERVVFQATGKLVRVGGDDDDAESPI